MAAGKTGRRAKKTSIASSVLPVNSTEPPADRRDQENRISSWKRPDPLTPWQMAILMACAIFVCENFAMYILATFLPEVSGVTEAILDSSMLLLLLSPIYLVFYRPFWEEHQIFSREVKLLSRKLLKTVEDERKRISHDLHDECGQTLTALQFGFEALRRGMPASCDTSKSQIQELSRIMSQLSNEMREVTHRLRPDLLDQVGLVPAIQGLVAEFSKLHPEIEVKQTYAMEEFDFIPIDADIEVALFRICQECLHNISKHAKAPAVVLRLERDEASITLNMGDHGVGFDLRKSRQTKRGKGQGVGLLGIRERVADLGGTFNLSTEVNKGTFITVKFPLLPGSEYD
jgi:signal transduction histidine kinase